MSKLLIDESPLQVLPSLACIIGLNEAIFLQQLHYWLKTSPTKKEHEGRVRSWIYNTYHSKNSGNGNTTGWESNFPFWSARTIMRIVESLRDKKLIITTDELNGSRTNRTLWYTIDYDELEKLSTVTSCHSLESDKLSQSRECQVVTLMTETTNKTTTKTTEAPSGDKPTSTPRKSKRDPRTSTPQIQAFKALTSFYPQKVNYDAVIGAIGEKTAEQLAPFYKEWTARGYNPRSIKWLTEWAARGAIPQNGNNGKVKQGGMAKMMAAAGHTFGESDAFNV